MGTRLLPRYVLRDWFTQPGCQAQCMHDQAPWPGARRVALRGMPCVEWRSATASVWKGFRVRALPRSGWAAATFAKHLLGFLCDLTLEHRAAVSELGRCYAIAAARIVGWPVLIAPLGHRRIIGPGILRRPLMSMDALRSVVLLDHRMARGR
jgi:hypothetical protein